jgi:hypothetical protein
LQTFFSEQSTPAEKVKALRKACQHHVNLTKECSKGLGQDRHLYALYCLLQKEKSQPPSPDDKERPLSPVSPPPSEARPIPALFRDPGWGVLNTSILSTSNCGNPALRLFGFGPVAADGFGLGYIIKEDGLSVCAASKHLQTRRFLDTLQGYLLEMQRMLVQLYLSANETPTPFVDLDGFLRDAKTGMKISEDSNEGEEDLDAVRECGLGALRGSALMVLQRLAIPSLTAETSSLSTARLARATTSARSSTSLSTSEFQGRKDVSLRNMYDGMKNLLDCITIYHNVIMLW